MRAIVIWLIVLMNALILGVCSASGTEFYELLPGSLYATGVYVQHGDVDGPKVLVIGGVHGNEPAGADGAKKLLAVRIKSGTLVVVPELNKLALKQNVRTLPEIGDINRAYPGDAAGTPAEQLASAVVSLVERYGITVFIDLHEARTFHRLDHSSLGQAILFANNDKSAVLALGAVEYINGQLQEPYKKFTFGAHPIPKSGAWYMGKHYGIAAFTVETSKKQPLEERALQHAAIAKYLATAEGMQFE